jgi:hypothetical protein
LPRHQAEQNRSLALMRRRLETTEPIRRMRFPRQRIPKRETSPVLRGGGWLRRTLISKRGPLTPSHREIVGAGLATGTVDANRIGAD